MRRELRVRGTEPATCAFPGARALVWERRRDEIKSAERWESRWFVGSRSPEETSSPRHAEAIKAHWAVENKLHWRKDAILREDDTRCRNRNVVTNLMLLRNLALHFYVHTSEEEPMTAWIDQNHWNIRGVLRFLTKKSWSK